MLVVDVVASPTLVEKSGEVDELPPAPAPVLCHHQVAVDFGPGWTPTTESAVADGPSTPAAIGTQQFGRWN